MVNRLFSGINVSQDSVATNVGAYREMGVMIIVILQVYQRI